MKTQTADDGLLNSVDVGAMLKSTPRYPQQLAQRGLLRCVRLGKKALRFRRRDVEAFIEARTVLRAEGVTKKKAARLKAYKEWKAYLLD